MPRTAGRIIAISTATFMATAGLTLSTSAPASASPVVSKTRGAKAKGYKRYVTIRDTRPGNSRQAYAEFKRRGRSVRTLWSGGGFNRTGKGRRVVKVRACVSINQWPDRCGRWKRR